MFKKNTVAKKLLYNVWKQTLYFIATCRKRLHLIYYERGDLKQQRLNRYLSNKVSPLCLSRSCWESRGGRGRSPDTPGPRNDSWTPGLSAPVWSTSAPRTARLQHRVRGQNTNTLLQCLGRFFQVHALWVFPFPEYFYFYCIDLSENTPFHRLHYKDMLFCDVMGLDQSVGLER